MKVNIKPTRDTQIEVGDLVFRDSIYYIVTYDSRNLEYPFRLLDVFSSQIARGLKSLSDVSLLDYKLIARKNQLTLQVGEDNEKKDN